MVFKYDTSIELWSYVDEQIIKLGSENYNLSIMKVLAGDLENSIGRNRIILLTRDGDI